LFQLKFNACNFVLNIHQDETCLLYDKSIIANEVKNFIQYALHPG